MLDFQIHWRALFWAAVLRQGLGLAWYSPLLFGRIWAELHGCTPSGMLRRLPFALPLEFACSLLMAFVLTQVLDFAGAIDWVMGLVVGMLMWLGFVAAATPNAVLYAGRPLRLFVIDTLFCLVSLVAMAVLIATWQWG